MIDFFNFEILITPYIIGIIYFIGAVVVPFTMMYYCKKHNLKINSRKYKLYFLIIFLMMEVAWRIFCEFFIVYFKIYMSLNS